MVNLLVSFYVGGYVACLLNARSTGKTSVSGSIYLLLWPLYGIITLMELINEHSDTIVAIVKKVVGVLFNGIKWFFGLFRSQ